MSLSKTTYCDGVQCEKLLWLLKNKPDVMDIIDNTALIDNGNTIHEAARDLFGEHTLIKYNKNLNNMIKETEEALSKDGVICEASFNYNNNFCSVDILIKNGNDIEIYEVKGSTKLKDVFITDLSYQVYVLSNLGYNVKKASVVTVNGDYVRNGDIELDKLFTINDVTSDVLRMQDEVERNITRINDFLENGKENDIDLDNHCFKPYKCPFFTYCSRDLPKDNVFELRGLYNKDKVLLYKKGIYTYEDLLKSKVNKKVKQQILHELNNLDDEIDYDKIEEFLDTLSYPLYFLDFETFQSPIPLFNGTKPYEQVPFQYSLHYLENDELFHKEYLAEAGVDPRRELAERLVRDIPMDVCTLAYNMSFEKTVIKNLARMYPDLSLHLMNIHDNIKDLMIPFKNRYYYNRDMHGSYSIKHVLPALFPYNEDLNYENLDLIHNGSEAMTSYADLVKKSIDEQKYIRERLLRYCELDTYAMVKIYEVLIGLKKAKQKTR
jgi:hypothetical protein